MNEPAYLGELAVKRQQGREKKAGRTKPSICDICAQPSFKICFDHSHVTKQFRGWICHNCNTALGLAKDDVQVLQKMIAYLERAKIGTIYAKGE